MNSGDCAALADSTALSRILSTLFTILLQSLERGAVPISRTRQAPETRRQAGFPDAHQTGPRKIKKMRWNFLLIFVFISAH